MKPFFSFSALFAFSAVKNQRSCLSDNKEVS